MPRKPNPKVKAQQPHADDRIRGRLVLEKHGRPFLAPSRVDLLQSIGELGSITSAAKAVGLSYKAAWDAVEAMNQLARAPLVSRSAGGSHGGGTRLTDYGKRIVQLVRRIEQDYADVIGLLEDPAAPTDPAQLTGMRGELSLRTSARNQWVGRVAEVTLGLVRAEVSVALGSVRVRSSVSAASVQRLGIAPGVPLCVLIKATSIELRSAAAAPAAQGTDNVLSAVVTDVKTGLDQLEVSAALEDKDFSLAAVVPLSTELRRLRKGSRVVASFAPERVVLVQLPIGLLSFNGEHARS